MSKTFKNRVSVRDAENVLEITDTPAGVRITVSDEDRIVSGWFNPDQGAEIALAILEAAGYTEDDTEVSPRKNLVATDYSLGMRYLRFGIEDQEHKAQAKKTAEAEAQAKLEAEAVKLANAGRSASVKYERGSVLSLHELDAEFWLAVARKAREIGAEK